MTTASLTVWIGVPAAILLILGGLLTLIGSVGVLRLPDFYARMHAPTMGTTLGTGCVLVASMLVSSGVLHRPVVHELVITLFLTMTAPVTAILLMQAARARTR